MKFQKIRAFIFLNIIKLLSKIFIVEVPPIVSVAAIIEKDGKLLFLDLSYLNGYGIPGGIIQKNEDLDEALKREILEETGLKINNHKYLWSISSSTKNIPTLSIFFKVEVTGETKNSKEGMLSWKDPNEVINNMAYESGKLGLQKYLNKKLYN
jgi:8-oxo-dGTP diphosphatase